jgi:hypothetical protein
MWGLNNGESTNGAPPLWLYVDLGKNYTITEAKVYYQTPAVNAQTYELDYLTNGSNPASDTWEIITNVTGNANQTTDDAINSITARYVRLYIANPYASTPNPDWGLKWFEFEVYGY